MTFKQLPNDVDPPLYDVWGSSYKAMDEFGIGVGLYYRQLLTFAIVRLKGRLLWCLLTGVTYTSRTCERLTAVLLRLLRQVLWYLVGDCARNSVVCTIPHHPPEVYRMHNTPSTRPLDASRC